MVSMLPLSFTQFPAGFYQEFLQQTNTNTLIGVKVEENYVCKISRVLGAFVFSR